MDKTGGNNDSRVKALLSHPLFQKYIARNESRERNRPFCRHDWQHLIDVARICYMLVLEAQMDSGAFPGWGRQELRDVVYAAGLLHDIGRWRQYDTGEDHALAGACLAGDILLDAQFSQREMDVITSAIANHRSGSRGGGALGEALRRADDLSRPCWRCDALDECRKKDWMPTVQGLVY